MSTSSPTRLSRRFAEAVVRLRVLVVVLVGVATIAAGFAVSRVGFRSDIDVWFEADDPKLEAYREFLARFETDEAEVVGVFAPDVFAPEVLAGLDRITRGAIDAPHVGRVRSLTNISVAFGDGTIIEVSPVIPTLPETTEDSALLRETVLEIELLRGLVNADGTATVVVIELDGGRNDVMARREMVRYVAELGASEEGLDLAYAGTPALDAATYEDTLRDTAVFGSLSFVVVLLCLWRVFGDVRLAAATSFVVGIATLWTFALLGVLGIDINIISSVIGSVVLAVGVADSVHVVSAWQSACRGGAASGDAAVRAVDELAAPCVATTLTTAFGMLSLMLGELAIIGQFGWLAASGIAFALVLSLTLLPALLSWSRPASVAPERRNARLAQLIVKASRLSPRGDRVVLAVGAMAVAASFLAVPSLDVGANTMNYFKENDPFRLDTRRIEQAFGGSGSLEFAISAPDGGVLDPDNLRALWEFERWLESDERLFDAMSIADQLVDVRQVYEGGRRPEQQVSELPTSRAMAAQLAALLEGGDDFGTLVTPSYSSARMSVRVSMSAADRVSDLLPKVIAEVDRRFGDGAMELEVTGFVYLMGEVEQTLFESQLRTLGGAFFLVTLMMVVSLRSIRLGLYSMIPNIAPVVVVLGIMSLVGIPLDPGTVMIGSISIGLVVDDTVHLLTGVRRGLARGLSVSAALEDAVARSGGAITATTLVLAAGFLVLAFGSFRPNIYFGLLTALVVLLAWVFDLMVLPAALRISWRRDLSRDPPCASGRSKGT